MVAVFCAFLLFLNPLPWLNFGSFLALPQPIVQLAIASMPTPKQALERLLTSEQIQANWFLPSFLEQVSPEQVQDVVEQLTRNFGEFQTVEETPDGFDVQFADGTVTAQIRITPEGQIAGLFFQPPVVPISLNRAIALMQNAPYATSLLVTKIGLTPASSNLEASDSASSNSVVSLASLDSETSGLASADLELADLHSSTDLAAVNADEPLAVGSAFKLAVLAALKNQIEEGHQQWDTVVQLQPEWKSLPSGMLQDWPEGTNLTLDTLATLMISISDNTATDALIDILGRETVEALASQNRPFLTTKEAFILKNPDNARLRRRYTAGNEATKRRVLQDVEDSPLPGKSLFSAAPIAPEVEWFFTARDLCNLMATVEDLDAMHVNPGVANPRDWEQIAFKGGSEPGVLSLTTGLHDAEGNAYCVSATWNSPDQPLDEGVLTQFYESVIAGLRVGA